MAGKSHFVRRFRQARCPQASSRCSLLKIPAKQGIIAESEAKPKSRNCTSGEMKDTYEELK